MREDADTEPEDFELPSGLALAWGIAAHPQRRGPKRELSLERIVDTAVEIADAEGLGSVSMAAVAKRLGYTTMSLYRYVSRKDDLLLLMGEMALDAPPLSIADATDWRAGLLRWHDEIMSVYTVHSWLLDLPIEGVPVTPAHMSWMDAALATLTRTPLQPSEGLAVLLLISGHARWQAIVGRGYVDGARRDGLDPQDLDRRSADLIDELVTDEQFPHLRAAIDAGVFTAGDDPLAFGLDRILDGIELYVAGRSAGAPPTVKPAAPQEHPTDAFPKDPAVKKARAARLAAQKAAREAQKKVREAVKREQEAVKRAREKQARGKEV